MERCAQCGAEAALHPVVAVMNTKDVLTLEETTKRKSAPVGMDPGGNWAALGVCTNCHQAPKLKGHFFMRKDAPVALRLADMKNLSLPRRK